MLSPTVLEAIKSAWEEHLQVDTEDGDSPTSGKNLEREGLQHKH